MEPTDGFQTPCGAKRGGAGIRKERWPTAVLPN
ncbi:UNVERIFIED_CONTAM: hypothetical protein GTU68_039896 [Idotea baltica]|nr:hypothetical protein [Idotea baltica]